MPGIIYNSVGLLGVILVLVAYFLLQVDRIQSDDLSYQVLNLLGALFVLFSLFFKWNLPAVVIEIVWIIMSFYGIVKYYRRKPHGLLE